MAELPPTQRTPERVAEPAGEQAAAENTAHQEQARVRELGKAMGKQPNANYAAEKRTADKAHPELESVSRGMWTHGMLRA